MRAFLGVPYAAPPVGALRWQAPQPVTPWTGVKQAATFGARCMQGPIFGDMVFRDQLSEDCLYLNVWAPPGAAKLPVMVWIYGGGFQAGSASEPRQDGSKLATKGVLVVSMNYRLGVFGFLAHPDLSKEASSHASGNYGLLDQIAALQWVKKNIAAFRRRSRQRHDLRRVGGIVLGQRADGIAADEGPVPEGDRRERRLSGGPERTPRSQAARGR